MISPFCGMILINKKIPGLKPEADGVVYSFGTSINRGVNKIMVNSIKDEFMSFLF